MSAGKRLFLLMALALLLSPASLQAQLLEKTDPQRELDLGRQVARQIEKTMPLSQDKALQARVERVGEAVVEQLEVRVYPYQFEVLALPEYNAFAIPGGFIYVYEGLLDRTADDDALAFVLAHEVTHVARRHWAERTEDMKGISVLGALAAEAIGGDGDLVAALATELVYLRYSRSDENEADSNAVELAWRAGFQAEGALTAMREMVDIEKGESVPKYLRNHPPARERLARLDERVQALKQRPRPTPAPPAVDSAAALSRSVGELPGVTPAPNPWFPLSIGNSWVYSVENASGARATYSVQIAAEIPLPSGKAYRADISIATSVVSQQLLTTPGEVWRRGRVTDPQSPWRLDELTELPEGHAVARDGWEYRLLGSESVSVPCGVFPEASRIRRQQATPAMTVDLWLVRGVGMVKRTVLETAVTETLTDYHVSRGQ